MRSVVQHENHVFASAAIEFGCARAEHLRQSPGFTLAVHDGGWAFCRKPEPAAAHSWVRERYRLRWPMQARGADPIVDPLVARLLGACRRLWMELSDAVPLRRLDLELDARPRPLALAFEVESGARRSTTFAAALEISIEDEQGIVGIARVHPPDSSPLTPPLAMAGAEIVRRHVGELRSCVGLVRAGP